MKAIESFYQNEIFGTKFAVPVDVIVLYGQIILMIVGADGEVSQEEWDHFTGVNRAMGRPEELIEMWRAYDWRKGNLEASAKELRAKAGVAADLPLNAVIYSAVRTARVDGYHEDERKAMRVAAA